MSAVTVFEIKRFAVHDGDGIRTTAFFKGCPLRCLWCHNPEGISPAPQLGFFAHKCSSCGACVSVCPKGAHALLDTKHTFARERCLACGKCELTCPQNALRLYGKKMTVEELLPLLLEDIEFYEASGGGVTLSGGECLAHADFCAELLRALKQNGIRTAVDTCGFVPWESFEKVLPFTDAFLYDIKAVDEAVHLRCTGQSNRLILENLHRLDGHGAHIELRVPVVPEYNRQELPAIFALATALRTAPRVTLLPYHDLAASKYDALGMKNTLPTRPLSEKELAALQIK